MKIWKYSEMLTKVETDLDLLDETFISQNEKVGYFNEALTEAESEIEELYAEYFLTKYYVPLVAGTGRYSLPPNIFANKIRGIIYSNGSAIYPVVQYKRRTKFQDIAFTDQYGAADDYRYVLVNDYAGQAQIDLHPVSRETAILPPSTSAFTPMVLWYIRNCARVPIVGEYCNLEVIATSQVSTGNNQIQTYAGTSTIGTIQTSVPGGYPGSIAYVTGDAIQFQPASGGTLPSPLVAGTTYYVIASGSGLIQVASSLANALASTPITLTTVGTVYFTMQVAATTAIINATLIDIPEFATFIMQWVKCRCLEKEGDPRLEYAGQVLAQQKKQMVDTLTNSIPDDNDEIFPDFSSYQEMS